MAINNNPAGRLWEIFDQLAKKPTASKDDLSKIFDTRSTWKSILMGVKGLFDELELLENLIEQFRDRPSQYSLYTGHLPEVRQTIESLNLNVLAKNYQFQVQPGAVVALRFIAAHLAEEAVVPAGEFAEILRLCDELQKEIHASETLHDTIKTWLLDLIRLMRDGVERYRIRGANGMRSQFHEMLGEVVVMYQTGKAQEVADKEPGIWNKMMSGIDKVARIVERAEASYKVLTFGQMAIDLVTFQAIPMLGPPTDLS